MLKKLSAILLVLVTVLSLYACGEQEETRPKDTEASKATEEKDTGSTEDTRETEPKISMEEIISRAEPIDYMKLMDLPALADQYLKDRVLLSTGYVASIREDYAEVFPLDGWLDGKRKPLVRILAYLPQKQLKQLHENQIITLAGIGKFAQPYLKMETAYYVGDDFTFEGTMRQFSFDPSGKKMMPVFTEGMVGSYLTSYRLRYYFDTTPEFEEKGTLTLAGTTIANEDKLKIVCKADFENREYSSIPGKITIAYYLTATEIKSVEKIG